MWWVVRRRQLRLNALNEACQDEIYGSAYAAAVYLSSIIKIPKNKKVYVIGQNGLEEELRDEGIHYIGGTVISSQLKFPSFHILTIHGRPGRTPRIILLSLSTSVTSPLTPMSPQSYVAWIPRSTTRSYQRPFNIWQGTQVVFSSRQTKTAHSRAPPVCCPGQELSARLCDTLSEKALFARESQRVPC
jgi:hypothetical protein